MFYRYLDLAIHDWLKTKQKVKSTQVLMALKWNRDPDLWTRDIYIFETIKLNLKLKHLGFLITKPIKEEIITGYQLNTFPIKYVEANKAFRQFKVLGNQINKNISITRVFLRLNHLDGTPSKYLTVLDTLKWHPWTIWDLVNFYSQ